MTSDIRALHVYRTYFPDTPGGVQEVARQVAIATLARGVRSSVFALSPNPVPPLINLPEGNVFREKSWAAPASCDLGGISSFVSFSRACTSSDILVYHFPWPFADVLHSVVRPKIPAVMIYHSDVVRQIMLGKIYAPLMWKMLKSMRFIIATSPAYVETSSVLSHPEIRGKVRVIPSGIDEGACSKDFDDSVFKRIGVSRGSSYFLFVGVLRYYKGLHTLIQAANQVDAQIIIAGSGPEERSLRSQAELCDAKNVVFAGQVTDGEKNSLLKACRALVLPSHLRSEAFGMVLVEAAIFGRPLISCEIGTGTSFVNAHEETGFVVPPESPAELANAMNQILRDESLAEQLGIASRSRYQRLFSGEVLGKAYSELYREALGATA